MLRMTNQEDIMNALHTYAISAHRKHGRTRYSIDYIGLDGQYLSQAALFFKTREEAERRLEEMRREDRENNR